MKNDGIDHRQEGLVVAPIVLHEHWLTGDRCVQLDVWLFDWQRQVILDSDQVRDERNGRRLMNVAVMMSCTPKDEDLHSPTC